MNRPLVVLGLALAIVACGAIAFLPQPGAPPREVRSGATAQVAPPAPPDPALRGVTAGRLAAARRFLNGRAGRTAFAVLDERGRIRGLRTDAAFPSASLSKAMLLVAYASAPKRRARALSAAERDLLGPMIRSSDNDAANAIFAAVGDAGLARVGRRARMRGLHLSGYWANVSVTAADQVRFFARVDRLAPRRHRPYVRSLLASIVPAQRWGIPKGAGGKWTPFFKGGWRPSPTGRLVTQAALLERGEHRVALAVLTDGSRSYGYAYATIAGVARRLAGPG